MVKTISLKLDEDIFSETEKILMKLKKPRNRNRYINEAIDYYNGIQRRLLLGEALKRESGLVQNESMQVLKEFEETGDGA